MRTGESPAAYLVLDWNGTVVDDLERAHAATLAAVRTVPGLATASAHLADPTGFRSRFVLPLTAFFSGLGVPPDRVEDVVRVWNAEMAAAATVLATGARDLLVRARELEVAVHVVSGAESATVRTDARALGVESLITGIAGSAHPKRDVVTALRCSDRPLVYVGDTEYDVREGAAAGAITVGTTYGYRPGEALLLAGAHLVIHDLACLIPLLESVVRQPPATPRHPYTRQPVASTPRPERHGIDTLAEVDRVMSRTEERT
jgi:phosphoglycolate phosphatase-like HAD superfamily hydrolase